MIYVFDLDGTICEPNLKYSDTERRYAKAVPVPSVITRMIKLHEAGHTIIIHTARRMVTHGGNVQNIILDVGKVTVTWLEHHKVPHNELVFGKPYGDFYIDDKAVDVEDFKCT